MTLILPERLAQLLLYLLMLDEDSQAADGARWNLVIALALVVFWTAAILIAIAACQR